MIWYTLLVVAVAGERVTELAVARRNAHWSAARGGVERGRRHYPLMVALHTGLLVGAVAEVWLAGRPFVPAVGWPMLAVAVAAQGLRWWCVTALGPRWNTRVIVVPGLPLVASGPYRLLRHPNYVAVVAEGVALPLVHSAWVTAAVFTVLNGWLLTVRIRCESAALAELSGGAEPVPQAGPAAPGLPGPAAHGTATVAARPGGTPGSGNAAADASAPGGPAAGAGGAGVAR